MEEMERSKYDRMHAVPGYSPGPGISHVRSALHHIVPGSSIIDFGCGTGDAANAFIEKGFKVYAVDISDLGLRHDLRFFKSPLHKLPKTLPVADWGFCCDVMEHLPPLWVGLSLRQMAQKVDNCYFSISGVPDAWGKKIGVTLHLTVMDGAWWLDQISDYWNDVLMTVDHGSSYEIIAKGSKRV